MIALDIISGWLQFGLGVAVGAFLGVVACSLIASGHDNENDTTGGKV